MIMMTTLVPVLVLVAVVGSIPLIAVIATSFTLISVVLMIVRNAIGVQQLPPNIIIYAVSIVLSIQIMGPTFERTMSLIAADTGNVVTLEEAIGLVNRVIGPWNEFLSDRTSEQTRAIFRGMVRDPSADLTPLQYATYVLTPAFMADELTRAFQIGLMIYIPFVALDLLVSAVLVVMSMQSLSPVVITAPLKLLLFVAVEGWTELLKNFILSYQ